MGDWLRWALVLAAKDLRLELRSKTSLLSGTVFAALVLLVFNFARDPTSLSSLDLAPSALWVTYAFASIVTLNRGFAVERENAALDGLLLAPLPRGALYLGKYLANVTFVLFIEAVTLPIFVLFFNLDLADKVVGIAGIALLATAGFLAAGTVFSAMVIRTRFAELMLPVLLLPFLVPPIMAAAEATARLFGGRPLSEILGWLRFLALFDVAFVTLCCMTFAFVLDE
jgi:heme exporter protein B